MVGTIIPIVYGNRRPGRPPIELISHSIGGIIGGVSCGFIMTSVSILVFGQSPLPKWLPTSGVAALRKVSNPEAIRRTLPAHASDMAMSPSERWLYMVKSHRTGRRLLFLPNRVRYRK